MLAPSGPPLSFSAVAISSVSIRLSWASPLPEELNGVLVSYRVIVTEDATGEVFQQTTAFDTNSLVVNSLHPYYNYQCSVAAFTIASGPKAYTQVRTLPEGIVLIINKNVVMFMSNIQHPVEVHKMQL